MASKILPDAAYVRECLYYDPATGAFIWRDRPQHHFRRDYEYKRWSSRYAGKPVGGGDGSRHDYQRTSIDGIVYRLHRLAWLLIHGETVPDVIDHIDGDPLNNRIANLRAATTSENKMNAGRRADNLSGVKGVFPLKVRAGRYVAYITVRGVRHHLGTFYSLEEAATARREATARLHGGFARHD